MDYCRTRFRTARAIWQAQAFARKKPMREQDIAEWKLCRDFLYSQTVRRFTLQWTSPQPQV
jgi:hypothetical protein